MSVTPKSEIPLTSRTEMEESERPLPAEEEKDFGSLFFKWAQGTGMHGMAHMVESKSLINKIIWCIILLGGTGVAVYQIALLFGTFYSNPYKILRKQSDMTTMPLPALSFCNLSPASRTKLRAHASANTDGTIGTNKTKLRRRRRRQAESNIADFDDDEIVEIYAANFTSTNQTLLENLAGQVPDSVEQQLKFLDHISSLTIEQRIDVSTSIDKFLVDCMFNGVYCGSDDFRQWLHPQYGACYTFNAIAEDTEQRDKSTTSNKIIRRGPSNGFLGTFFIDQSNYIGAVAQTAGVRVVIHDRSVMPFPDINGISLSPGVQTSIGYQMKTFGRLPHPYEENCKTYSEEENLELNLYASPSRYSLPKIEYSRQACIITCIQKQIEMRCNCSNPAYPPSNPHSDPAANSDSQLEYCQLGLDEDSYDDDETNDKKQCIEDNSDPAEIICQERCRVVCSETVFEWKASSSQWPSDRYETLLKRTLLERNDYVRESFAKAETDEKTTNYELFVANNFLQILIYLESYTVESIESEKSYQIFDLLADMGGQCGLWLGLSVLTFAELIEITAEIVKICSLRLYAKPK